MINFKKLQFSKIVVNIKDLQQSFARSSGPGGQNVNKVNTKVELRFSLDQARWLPNDVKERLKLMRPQNVAQDDFIVVSQLTRHQESNIRDALDKLQSYVDLAAEPPKERVIEEYKEPVEVKFHRIDMKRKRSDIKKLRSGKFDF